MNARLRAMVWMIALVPMAAGAASQAKSELNDVLRAKADAVRGAGLFAQCAACHGADGNGDTRGSTPRIPRPQE